MVMFTNTQTTGITSARVFEIIWGHGGRKTAVLSVEIEVDKILPMCVTPHG